MENKDNNNNNLTSIIKSKFIIMKIFSILNQHKNYILKFEGEYFNGERNGKGKEYYSDGKLRFEGEYLNGKIWNGKGYCNGNIVYEIKDGKGHIKEYDYNGNLEFEG